MKDKACCFDCLHCKSIRGIHHCELTKKELINPFENKNVCKKFECFQCAKHERECKCYEEVK